MRALHQLIGRAAKRPAGAKQPQRVSGPRAILLLSLLCGILAGGSLLSQERQVPGSLSPVASGEGDSFYTPPWPERPNTTAILLRLCIGTAVVLALCVATLWFGKRWIQGPPATGETKGQLKLLESISLGNRCSVHLLQAGNVRALAGTDATGLQALVQCSEPFDEFLHDRLQPERADTEDEREVELPLRA